VTELAAPRRDPANVRGWQS